MHGAMEELEELEEAQEDGHGEAQEDGLEEAVAAVVLGRRRRR